MEASAAGLASGDAAQAQGADGQQGQEGQQGQQAGADTSQFADQLQSLTAGQEEMRQFLETLSQQTQGQAGDGQQQQDAQVAAPDLSFLNEPGIDEQTAAARLQQVMRGEAGAEVQRLLQEQLGPLQTQVSDMRRTQETDALVAEFPDLGKEDVAQATVAAAGRLAEQIGNPELAANVGFMRVAYLAGRATELAQQQNGAADGSGVATLEGAGGASPGGAAQGANQPENFAEKWGKGSDVLSKL